MYVLRTMPPCHGGNYSLALCTLQGVPAIAVSLDNYKALTPEGFMAGAAYVVALIQARTAAILRKFLQSSCS